MEAMDTDEREEVGLDVEVRSLHSMSTPHHLTTPQVYASQFSGHAKVDRLLFIAKKTRGQQLETDALRLAAEELKKVRGIAWMRQEIDITSTDDGYGTIRFDHGNIAPAGGGSSPARHVRVWRHE